MRPLPLNAPSLRWRLNLCGPTPELSIHQPTGHVYMGCSTIADRLAWSPYFNIYRSWTPSSDYAAVYDPSTKTFTRLQIEGLPEPDPDHPRGLHAHGLHVVSSSTDPNTVFVYLVNHRPQPYGSETYGKEDLVGADEAVQIFKTTIGSSVLTHVATFDDPSVVITPNDISGSADGKSFFFTNDEPARSGPEGKWARVRRLWFNAPITTVGYCHVDEGCKTVASGISSANGIVRVSSPLLTYHIPAGIFHSRQAISWYPLGQRRHDLGSKRHHRRIVYLFQAIRQHTRPHRDCLC